VLVLAHDGSGRLENSILIPRNAKIPTKRSGEYSTTVDRQTELRVQVTQGDDVDPEYVKQIGEQVLAVPPYPQGAPIRVEFAYDIDQTISISVFDLTADMFLGSFEIDNSANLTEDEIRKAITMNNDTEVG